MKANNLIDPSNSKKPVMYINLVRLRDEKGEYTKIVDSVFDDAKIRLEDEVSLNMEIEWRRGNHEMHGFRVVVNHYATK